MKKEETMKKGEIRKKLACVNAKMTWEKLFGKYNARLSLGLTFSQLTCCQLHYAALEQKPIKNKGLLRQWSKHQQADYVSHTIFWEKQSGVCRDTCASICLPLTVSLKINRTALVGGSQTVLHLYWNSQLPTVLSASAQHWPPRALICSASFNQSLWVTPSMESQPLRYTSM